jgi:hypothetical protein
MFNDERIADAAEVVARTGPRPFARGPRETRVHGQRLDMYQRVSAKQRAIDQASAKTARPQGAVAVVPLIESGNVTAAHRLHQATERSGVARRGQQANFGIEQGVAMDRDATLMCRFSQHHQERRAVTVIDKHALTVVTALHQVVQLAGQRPSR